MVENINPEQQARIKIDEMLKKAGWKVQSKDKINLGASLGVAVREMLMKDSKKADYILFVNRKAVGVIEAKAVGKTLSGVEFQSAGYMKIFPDDIPHYSPLPFAYESTGVETFFRNEKEPDYRSRRVHWFHKPETLKKWAEEEKPLRERLRKMPVLNINGLRDCQIEAVTNLEKSFAQNHPRALIQMATGSGKTFTAITFIYRLIKFAGAKRILFLVDRKNLGEQAEKEFQNYTTPDDGRKFTQLYNVQRLKSNTIDDVCKVTITTIQRLYSMLKGDEEFLEENEENSAGEIASDKQFDVEYNPAIPIEHYDFIVTDECHRSIYNLWRQVLEYFDGFLIGLTATPSLQTMGFFNKNLVMEYSHERAVVDRVNVGYEVYRIRTQITETGSKVEAKNTVDVMNKKTREKRGEILDQDLVYRNNELDRSVVAQDQIRTVIRTYKEKLFTEIMPGRTMVPKTLIFAKDDNHAENIVRIVREEFGKGNEFAKKITYRVSGEDPKEILQSFRNSTNPRIAVTVDMIATGVDVRPLEVLLFMRDVRSANYFEQMKGRGTRVIDDNDLKAVTSDAEKKTHFVIVDAVGVCESDKTNMSSMERKKGVSFEKLLESVVFVRDDDTLQTLAGRLAKLDAELTPKQREEFKISFGTGIQELGRNLVDAMDKDVQIAKAKELYGEDPSEKQVEKVREDLVNTACAPLDDPDFRKALVEIKKQTEIIIDIVSIDETLEAGFSTEAKEKAEKIVKRFSEFIEENKDEITALQVYFSKPYSQRHITYDSVKELAEKIQKPPYLLNQENLWNAYRILEESKVKGKPSFQILTNIISLVRYALHKDNELMPFPELVEIRFENWVQQQQESGIEFTAEQLEWLELIKSHIANNAEITRNDLELPAFSGKGGLFGAYDLFGEKLEELINELNGVLVA
ncbi:type I restriction-modification enzyme R subunit C-terminal domain-containing protein [Geovibrio sp. ADMFC3]